MPKPPRALARTPRPLSSSSSLRPGHWTLGGALLLFLLLSNPTHAARQTLSLNGTWQIQDSVDATPPPDRFEHSGPVPGLANLSQPPFPDVDAFLSREQLANRIRAGTAPALWLTNHWAGKVDQARNYFWYRTTFRAPARRDAAILTLNKAQFGAAVWLNDQYLGSYAGCFSAGRFALHPALRWNADNTLVLRIGAHPAVLPDTYPTGSDFEKIRWTPGIYDEVSVHFCDNPVIESVQVAPRIAPPQILVQTRLRNPTDHPVTTTLTHQVTPWKSRRKVAEPEPRSLTLNPGEDRVITQTIPLPSARLWSPEDPFLYVLETRTDGDSLRTRFGVREFRFDGPSRRAYLNGQVYYLRGSNITLHRFFEDPLCRDLPWNEAWVRQLLGRIPRHMHWNYFRFCIGPVPDRWLDLCDELGLLVQNEFFVWTGGPGWYPGYSRTHDAPEMIRQYADWMRDNWNHPSVVVWDANNESKDESFTTTIIPAVRPLDLSRRPWENSYNTPVDPDDPVEDHPYLMQSGHRGPIQFKMSDLETRDGQPRPGSLPSDRHAPLINEYGWLWLNRDGSPTCLTSNVYAHLLGPNATARERLDLYAYLLAGKTEFWRAHRGYAGIIHFVYLTCSYPGVYTADHFTDVTRLRLDPAFADYLGEAFKPLGVYLNCFQPTLPAGTRRAFEVRLVNDHPQPLRGQLELTLRPRAGGRVLARTSSAFNLSALGSARMTLELPLPNLTADCLLQAVARPEHASRRDATRSRRWVRLVPQP